MQSKPSQLSLSIFLFNWSCFPKTKSNGTLKFHNAIPFENHAHLSTCDHANENNVSSLVIDLSQVYQVQTLKETKSTHNEFQLVTNHQCSAEGLINNEVVT